MTPQQERAVTLRDERLYQLTGEHTQAEMTLIMASASAIACCDLIYRELQSPVAVAAMNDLLESVIVSTAGLVGLSPEQSEDNEALVTKLMGIARQLVNDVNDAADSKIITADNAIQLQCASASSSKEILLTASK